MNAEDLSLRHACDPMIPERVLHAIAANRNPGLHFIGHFVNLEWQDVSGGEARSILRAGPHCCAANGEIDLAVLGIFMDHSLAAAIRKGVPELPSGARLGTLQIQAQFTGIPGVGDLVADSLLIGRSTGAALPQSFASAAIRTENAILCHVRGTYASLKVPPGITLSQLPWEREQAATIVPVDVGSLDPTERKILEDCGAALRNASRNASFIQHFWGGLPRRTNRGASNHVPIRAQIINRVGHVHGGVLFGLAAANACAAAPPRMMLWNVSAFFIAPGRGSALAIRSHLLHAGGNLAVVRTVIRNSGGERVFEAISNHVLRNPE